MNDKIEKQLNDLEKRIIEKEFQLEDTVVPSEITKIQKVLKKLKKQRTKLFRRKFNR